MSGMPPGTVLVINAGSSSLKAGLFVPGAGNGLASERAIAAAEASGIGGDVGRLEVKDGGGKTVASVDHAMGSQTEALQAVVAKLQEHGFTGPPEAVGHRIVHGGPQLVRHTRLTPEVLATLRQSVHFAPLHLPGSLALIEATRELFPGVVQVACFDTAFHQTMPPEAATLPIPRAFRDEGIRRYGFHGLSYESVVAQLQKSAGGLPERIVIAHLGSGSSLCAVKRGQSIDTTMGLTPTGGILMATRTGDMDPGVLLMMMRVGKCGTDAIEQIVNHQSGLAGVSGGSGDMRQMQKERTAPEGAGGSRTEAELAFEMFAIAVAKAISALIVPLRGLDLLVFTGGIGEHDAPLRASIVHLLAPIGLQLGTEKNIRNDREIAGLKSRAGIQVLPAEEDLVIAKHTRRILSER